MTMMSSKLAEIKRAKLKEVSQLQILKPNPREGEQRLFSRRLKQAGLSVIAEVKRASPTAGQIAAIDDPLSLATAYIRGGAQAISVLTDTHYFRGSLADLERVAKGHPTIPVLRKDFVIHPMQIYEAVLAGASAVLLIVALLGEELVDFLRICEQLKIEALVEVNNLEELEIATAANSEIIAVNNRNLNTFEVDLAIAERLSAHLPAQAIKVAASGMHRPEDTLRMALCGYDAVLVGEALVRSSSPEKTLAAMRSISCE